MRHELKSFGAISEQQKTVLKIFLVQFKNELKIFQ